MNEFSTLSPLEANVLNVLWPNKKLKVRQIHSTVKTKKKVALTSVAVALDRLHTHGIVDRTVNAGKGGLSYVYFPKKTRKEFEKGIMEKTVNALLEKFGATAISYFNERFEKRRK
ncbi:MAG: BlaI/MecI/CopY family transcriptional regulator [Candidatus Aenigmarchaeota archaeon]|nr:BlaI/MecI/CopY family transcriptional regulator [Candidatus Aenigmarchaeota archaeon]